MYKLHLILKYLRKGRIAWISVLAVMLCTAMLLVVVSIMGGWLAMVRQSFKVLNGDVVVQPSGSVGLAFYEQMLDRIRQLPDAAAAMPVIHAFGLLKIGTSSSFPVRATGYKINEVGKVNRFLESLHRQKCGMPSFKPFLPASDYRNAVMDKRGNLLTYPGMIVGIGVVGIHKNKKGEVVGRTPRIYRKPATLTVVDTNDSGPVGPANAKYRTYWIVDDSQTNIFDVDANTVYVPFDILQGDLGMTAHDVIVDGQQVSLPARTSEIDIRARKGADVQKLRAQVKCIVTEVLAENGNSNHTPVVLVWDQQPGIKNILGGLHNESVVATFLFSLISLVAAFLIFGIFYMIVAEKTRDIGIIKSVGASNAGVAQIFLGYGLAIGIVGGLSGLLLGYCIVHNINFIHGELIRRLGIQIWSADVFGFDTIPNTVNGISATVIVVAAIVSSVLGALVPALRAAKLNPVEALQWE